MRFQSTAVEWNMTTPRPTSRAEQRRRTEARILDAATQAFFSAGYDRTPIRAVAAAAGGAAGRAMPSFGTKQELYRRVIDAAPVPELSGTPGEAAEQILDGIASRLESEPAASLALLRSMLTNPEAASAASAGIARYPAQTAPAAPLALLAPMLTNPGAPPPPRAGLPPYQAQIAQAIPADDADLRAAMI